MVYKKIDKATVLQRVTQLFKQKGYHFSSMEQIAYECGLSKSSIYHYAVSKEAFLKWVLLEFHHQLKETVFLRTKQYDAPAEKKLWFLAEQLKVFYLNTDEGCLMANILMEVIETESTYRPLFKSFFNDWIEAIAAILGEKLNHEMAVKIAEDMTAQCQGALLLARVYQDNKIFTRVLDRLSSLLLVKENELVAFSEC